MGKGMRAGRLSKIEKTIRKHEIEEQQKFVNSLRANLEEAVSDTLAYHHNLDMIAVMFALRDEFGFGKGRILRVIRRSCEHAERMIADRANVDDMLDILKGETGICEDDLMWEVKLEV